MNRLFLVLSICLCFLRNLEPVSEAIIVSDGIPMYFDIMIPSGYTITRVESGTDMDNYIVFSYPDGSFLFVSNKWSPNTESIVSKYHVPESSIPITNNDSGFYTDKNESDVFIDGVIGNPRPDSLIFKGHSLFAKYWGEKEYPDYCIGYRKVSYWNKNVFEASIDSFHLKSSEGHTDSAFYDSFFRPGRILDKPARCPDHHPHIRSTIRSGYRRGPFRQKDTVYIRLRRPAVFRQG